MLDAGRYFHVEAEDEALDDLAAEMRNDPDIETAFIKPPGETPVVNVMTPSGPAPTPVTTDFSARQTYRDAAPNGVDVQAGWALPGGRGAGVEIIDLEWNWEFLHEDLPVNFRQLVLGVPSFSSDHGTAVVGVLGADENGFGVTGICPDAVVGCGAFGPPTATGVPSATAINQAAAMLKAGDILLLEIHRPGPRHGFAGRLDQLGYIAIEWWPDDFIAIEAAVQKGIIVVEAAGNGAEDLDDVLYDTPDPAFPASWVNPFRRAGADPGAVIVGAGAAPVGTHGRGAGPDRSRLGFSNFGSCVDVQGWGEEVTTTGYGDLQGGAVTTFYTDLFGGTSSASPIVSGVLACLQGIRIANGSSVIDSLQARRALRVTGSAQQSAPTRPATQRIGNRPDLAQLIAAFSVIAP
jgi:subtilisin family serine protease